MCKYTRERSSVKVKERKNILNKRTFYGDEGGVRNECLSRSKKF